MAITDSNVLNPACALKLARLRLGGRRHAVLRTQAGLEVRCADERLFAPRRLARRLRGLGLHVEQARMHGFFPPSWPGTGNAFRLAQAWEARELLTPRPRRVTYALRLLVEGDQDQEQ